MLSLRARPATDGGFDSDLFHLCPDKPAKVAMNLRYSTRRLEAIRATVTPSQHIAHVDDLEPGQKVVALCRESVRCNKAHLDDQESNLRRRGFDVIGVFKEVAPADAEDRTTSELAAIKAKEANAVLVAESTNRFVRGYCYRRGEGDKPRRIAVAPNVIEFERALALFHGAKLATLWHPDLSEKEVRKLQSSRGQRGNRGGRPAVPVSKKRWRELKAAEAVKLRLDGLSLRKISRALSVPCSTVRDWIEDAQYQGC